MFFSIRGIIGFKCEVRLVEDSRVENSILIDFKDSKES